MEKNFVVRGTNLTIICRKNWIIIMRRRSKEADHLLETRNIRSIGF